MKTQTAKTSILFTIDPVEIPVLTERQINNRMRKVADLDAQIKALQAARDALTDEIKAAMTAEHIETANFKINNTVVKSKRFDSKAFKADHADLYTAYQKETETRRFSYTVK